MKTYFAPLEGITTYTYRNAHCEMFGMCDAYFAPFITPTDNEKINKKNLRDILEENNTANIKVQALCSSGTAFADFAKKIKEIGYDEINLNFGCPSGTVVKRERGAGALKNLRRLDALLEYIFANSNIKISVKTRTGFYEHEEFDEILEIYNKYPITELIVHPRVREEYYKNTPNMESFDKAYLKSRAGVCYNGDITSKEEFEKIVSRYENLSAVMIGRGAIKNPAIFREINGGKRLETSELIEFSYLLEKRYLKLLGSDTYTLNKLKEIWMYAMQNFPEEKKILKAIKKSARLSEFDGIIGCLPEIK